MAAIYWTRFADTGSQRQSFSSYDELGRVVRSVGEPDDLNQRLQTCLKFDTLGNLTEVWAGPTTRLSSWRPTTVGVVSSMGSSVGAMIRIEEIETR